MINLRTKLLALLKSLHTRTYFQSAPETAVFPYVVFDLPNSFPVEEQEIFALDVDVWDNAASTVALENLASLIWKELNNYRHIDSNIQFTIYRANRLSPIDDDPRIKRRKLMFQLKYFDRRINE